MKNKFVEGSGKKCVSNFTLNHKNDIESGLAVSLILISVPAMKLTVHMVPSE